MGDRINAAGGSCQQRASPDAEHELVNERDPIGDQALGATLGFFDQHGKRKPSAE